MAIPIPSTKTHQGCTHCGLDQLRVLRLASEIEVAKTNRRHSEEDRAKHEASSRPVPCTRIESVAPFENNVHNRLSKADVRLLSQLVFDPLLHFV